MNKSRGFTLLELLVTIAVAAILAAIALPNFSSQIASSHAQSLMNQFASDVSWTRSKAVASDETLTLTFNNPACTWQSGIYVNGAFTTTFTAHTMTSNALASGSYSQVQCSSGGSVIMTFKPDGTVTMIPASSLNFTFSAGGQTWALAVLPSGSIVFDPSNAS